MAPVFDVNLGLELVVAEVIGTPGTWDFANLPPPICRLGFLISVHRDVNATWPFFESEAFTAMFRMGDERPQEARRMSTSSLNGKLVPAVSADPTFALGHRNGVTSFVPWVLVNVGEGLWVAGGPNNPVRFKNDATADELREEIMRRLEVLTEAGILDLTALPAPKGLKANWRRAVFGLCQLVPRGAIRLCQIVPPSTVPWLSSYGTS